MNTRGTLAVVIPRVNCRGSALTASELIDLRPPMAAGFKRPLYVQTFTALSSVLCLASEDREVCSAYLGVCISYIRMRSLA